MNIFKSKTGNIEKELYLLLAEALTEIENVTGERTVNAESIEIKLGFLPKDIGGRYLFKSFNNEGEITLSTDDVLHFYGPGNKDREALRRNLLPMIAHECMHHLFYTTGKTGMHKPNWVADGFEEAPAYFVEYYIASKIFEEGDGYTKMLKNIKSTNGDNINANFVRIGMTSGLCKMTPYTTDHYKSIALKLAHIDNTVQEDDNNYKTGKINAAELGRAISLMLFAANNFNILKTMHELNISWQDSFYNFSRKLGETEHFDDAVNKLNEIGKIHAKINHMWWCNRIYKEKCTENIKKELRFSDAALGIESLLRNSNGTAQSEQIKT